MKLKVCGMTRSEDLELASVLGFDYTGFIFHPPSPRAIKPEDAALLRVKRVDGASITQKSSFPKRVGVFVDLPMDEVRNIARVADLDIIQLHGKEDANYCENLGLPWWKALRIKDLSDIAGMSQYRGGTVLIDAFQKDAHGGTGKKIDRVLVEAAVTQAEIDGINLILAGGLNEDSVDFLQDLPLYAADFNSGLEISPGVKDHEKMKILMENIEKRGKK